MIEFSFFSEKIISCGNLCHLELNIDFIKSLFYDNFTNICSEMTLVLAKIIMHSDMDAFYANIEQVANPRYQGKPLIVVMGPRSGVVATCSYEARKIGVKTGMSVSDAYRVCPHGIYVSARLSVYMQISRGIFKIYQKYSPIIEYYSIDEAFLDLTGCERLFGPAQEIGKKIKAEIYARFGLTCSIGIAKNKILAKMAGELEKPNGLTTLNDEDIQKRIWPLPVKDLFSVGRKTSLKLQSWGMRSIGDIARANPDFLHKQLGVIGKVLSDYANGRDDSPVLFISPDAKGCGHSRTLDYNVGNKQEIRRHIYELSRMISTRLRVAKQKGRTISFRMRYHDFSTRTRKSFTLRNYTDLDSIIYNTSCNIFEELWNGEDIRQLGITVSNLTTCSRYEQLTLFDTQPQKEERLALLQDELKLKFGENVLVPASLLNFKTRRPFVVGGRFGLGKME